MQTRLRGASLLLFEQSIINKMYTRYKSKIWSQMRYYCSSINADKTNIIKLANKPYTLSNPCMVRDFIHDRLYCPDGGYFSKEANHVGALKEPIIFSKLTGYYDYRQELKAKYPQNAWLTPSEVFKPYYGYLLANYIATQWKEKERIQILEIGPGSGGMAESILDFFKNYHLGIYESLEYTLVEISPVLARRCEVLLRNKYPKLYESGRIKVYNGSIMDYNKPSKKPTFVIALEVLDNMPHDRLYMDTSSNKIVTEALVSFKSDDYNGEVEEIRRPLQDSLCQQFVKIWETMPEVDEITLKRQMNQEGLFRRILGKLTRRGEYYASIFAPTSTLSLFQHLNSIMPNHNIMFADYDFLIKPSKSVKGINAPVVANKLKDPTKWHTYTSYLINRGDADICFPVDFYFLSHAYSKITGKKSSVMKTWEFVDKYGLENWCTTSNGYNPMRDEFINTSFLLTSYN